MHVISRKALKEANARHGGLEAALDAWYRVAKRGMWTSLVEIQAELPTAEAVGKYTVFNIKGNTYRLIAEINYRSQRLFIRHILSHAEYDKDRWKS